MSILSTTPIFHDGDQVTSNTLNSIIGNATFTNNAIVSGGGLTTTTGSLDLVSPLPLSKFPIITADYIGEGNITSSKIESIGPHWTSGQLTFSGNITGITNISTGNLTVSNNTTITGNLTITGSLITSQIKFGSSNPVMPTPDGDQNSAPIYGARAFLTITGSVTPITVQNLATSRASNTSAVIITHANHGFKSGYKFWFDFSSTYTDGFYEITLDTIDPTNKYSIQPPSATPNNTATVSIILFPFTGKNINSVSSYTSIAGNATNATTGNISINLQNPMPSINYSVIASGEQNYKSPVYSDKTILNTKIINYSTSDMGAVWFA